MTKIERRDGFSSRFGLIVAALGMAIGTGNIWRFPRVAANYEGGAFLIPWVIFLFTWSIPILIAEFTLGKTTGRGPIGAFAKLLGKRTAWMGAFMAFVTLMIATYYSVVAGWTLKYLVEAVQGLEAIPAATDPDAIAKSHDAAKGFFTSFATPGGAWYESQALYYHLGAAFLAALIVLRGIKGGVELACKLLIPTLFLLLLGGSIYVITQMEGALSGVEYLFNPNWALLGKPDIWIDALSQSAWSTGAGWGLILAYGAASRKDEDAVVNNRTAALGNNTASLLAGLFIFPAVFALLGKAGMHQAEITGVLKSNESGMGGSGLAFTYIPFIFKSMGEMGSWFTIAFFAGLFIAALSSLIAMYEMGTRVFLDMGFSRLGGVSIVALIGMVVGGFCALDMELFVTMDWVWGLALVLGGLIVCWAVQTYGAQRYRTELINESGAQKRLGPFFDTLFVFLIPAQGIGLLAWWLGHAASDPGYYGAGNHPWDPTVLGTYGVGPCVVWWVTAAAFFWTISSWLGQRSLAGDSAAMIEAQLASRFSWWRIIGLVAVAAPWMLWFQSERIFGFVDENVTQKLPENSWMGIAGFVGLVLVGGFFWNVIQATRKRP